MKKETLKTTVFLLLPSLLFSQFWKLDIKQVCDRSGLLLITITCISTDH